MNKRVFDMGAFTHTSIGEGESITLDNIANAKRELEAKFPEIVQSRFMPLGYWAIAGKTSMAIGTPNGILFAQRRHEFAPWKIVPPPATALQSPLASAKDLTVLESSSTSQPDPE